MNYRLIIAGLLSLSLAFTACKEKNNPSEDVEKGRELIITSNLISSNFVGNGAQWGGYDVVPTWLGTETLSEADWNKLFKRIDFMRPPFLRILTSDGWSYNNNGEYDESSKTKLLFKMLEYAQSRNIEIVYGEWGHGYTNSISEIDMDWLANSVKFLDHLVNDKGYTCIKTVNIINEPNGSWSSTKGNYNIWKNVQLAYIDEMAKYSLSSVKLMGPDVAVFNSSSQKDWITKSVADLGEHIGIYDIHVYPKQLIVRDGEYTAMLRAYRDVTPASDRIVLGEIGFKYTEVDAELKQENEEAIANDPYAGDDSNMKVYEAFYGIDMSDAILQSIRAGFSGALVWNMDDAMYNSPDDGDYKTDKLKRWGFWNILGEEHCNDAADEEIRPYFYPISLLCRFFPAGSDIYDIEMPNKRGLRAVMASQDGKYTIAIVNSHYASYPLTLKSDFIKNTVMNKYIYKSNTDGTFIGEVDENGFATPKEIDMNVDFNSGVEIALDGQSFILFTNME